MPFQGDLKAIGLFDVVQNIVHNQLTGTLHVSSGRGFDRWVAFADGRVRFASLGSDRGLPMQDFLVQRGFVDARAMDEALERHRRGRPALRNVLSREGLLDADAYRDALRLRIEELLYELFAVRDARFEFVEGDLPDGVFDRESRGVPLEMDPMPLLMESARRDDEWERIQRVVGSPREFFVRTGEAPVEADLVEIWNALDGATDVATLEHTLPFGRFEIWGGIAALVQSNQARGGAPDEILASAECALDDGDDTRARALLERACEYERSDRDLRRRLAELYERLGESKLAAEHWAVVGYQAVESGDDAAALDSYRRAVELMPDELALRERWTAVVARVGTATEFEAASLDLAARFASCGLDDRACALLERALEHPELAGREELVERYVRCLRDQGRAEDARGVLTRAISVARRGKEDARERRLLGIATALFPDGAQFAQQLREIETGIRGARVQLRRRCARLGVVAAFACLAVIMSYEEMAFRRQMDNILHTLPQRVAHGETIDVLAETHQVADAHRFALSRGIASVLANSLIEAERIVIERSARAERFGEARRRILVLREFAPPPEKARLADLRQRIERRAQVYENLEPWMRGSGSERAFCFEARDADQVREIYARLGPDGQRGVRRRFLELSSVSGIPAFTLQWLQGVRTETAVKAEVPVFGILRELLATTRSVEWQRARDQAYGRVVDAWIGGDDAVKARALQLLPLFVEVPPRLPDSRQGLIDLAAPAR